MGVKTAEFTAGLRQFEAALAPEKVRAELAAFARAELGRAIASGAASPAYRRYVNGVEGASEESVKLPGPILYVFEPLGEAVEFAIAYLRTRYPARGPGSSGHYAESWLVLVNGRKLALGAEIPPGTEAVIVNTQPYARKVHVGARGFEAGKGLLEDARQLLLKKWRLQLDAQVRFITLAGGYVLKGRGGDAASWAARPGRASRNNMRGRGGARGRKDLIAGTPMKYPALVIAGRRD